MAIFCVLQEQFFAIRTAYFSCWAFLRFSESPRQIIFYIFIFIEWVSIQYLFSNNATIYVPYVKPVIQISYYLWRCHWITTTYAVTDCRDDRSKVISLSADASSLSIPLSSPSKQSL